MSPFPWGRNTAPQLTTIRRDDPRYAHLPLVRSRADGTVEVIRGDVDVDELLTHDDAQTLFRSENVGRLFLVVRNGLGDVWFAITDTTRTWAGLIEEHLYTAPLHLQRELAGPATLEELRDRLLAELDHVAELAAEGWELLDMGESYRLLTPTGRRASSTPDREPLAPPARLSGQGAFACAPPLVARTSPERRKRLVSVTSPRYRPRAVLTCSYGARAPHCTLFRLGGDNP